MTNLNRIKCRGILFLVMILPLNLYGYFIKAQGSCEAQGYDKWPNTLIIRNAVNGMSITNYFLNEKNQKERVYTRFFPRNNLSGNSTYETLYVDGRPYIQGIISSQDFDSYLLVKESVGSRQGIVELSISEDRKFVSLKIQDEVLGNAHCKYQGDF